MYLVINWTVMGLVLKTFQIAGFCKQY